MRTLIILLGILFIRFSYAQTAAINNQYFPSQRESHIQVVYNYKNIEVKNMDSGKTLLKCSDFIRDIKYNDYADFCDNNQFSEIIVDWNNSRDRFWTYGYVFLKDSEGRSIHAIVATNGSDAKITFNQAPSIADDDYPVEILWGSYQILLRYNFVGYGYISYIRADGAYYGGLFDTDNYARRFLGIRLQSESFNWDPWDDGKMKWIIKGIDHANIRHCFHGVVDFRPATPLLEKFPSECEI